MKFDLSRELKQSRRYFQVTAYRVGYESLAEEWQSRSGRWHFSKRGNRPAHQADSCTRNCARMTMFLLASGKREIGHKESRFPLVNRLPFGRLWYYGPNATGNALKFAKFNSRSHDALIRVYDEAGNVIDRHAHAGGFKEWSTIHTSDFAHDEARL
jgi:hypothetical protein